MGGTQTQACVCTRPCGLVDQTSKEVHPGMYQKNSLDNLLQVPCFANLRASEYPPAPPPAWWAFDASAVEVGAALEPSGMFRRTVCKNGRAYRVLRDTERLFYEQLAATESTEMALDGDDDAPALSDFCPEFLGLCDDDDDAGGDGERPAPQLLVLEDVCAGLSQPVLCRLRMGTRGAWALEAKSTRTPLSRQRRFELWQRDLLLASGSLGWVVADEKSGCDVEREELGDEEAVEYVVNFLRGAGSKCGTLVARSILRQLVELCRWFRSPGRRVQLYGSSLLLAFDGDEDALRDVYSGGTAIVRMLNFAHTAPVQHTAVDDSGYFVGLLSLVAIFAQLARPGALFGSDDLPEEPFALQYGQVRAGLVAFATVRSNLCVLAVTSPDGNDWILPAGRLADGEKADEAGERIGIEEADSRFTMRAPLPRRILVEGSTLRLFAFAVADGKVQASVSEKAAETGSVMLSRAVEQSLSRAVEWAVVRSTGLGADRVRAWFNLSDALGLFMQHWAFCMLQQGLNAYRETLTFSV